MNTQQAKLLSLPDLLTKLGHQPARTLKAGKELWYCSPFRNELEPSFHTSFLGGKWIWNDFGDTGGNVLEFVMRYYNTDVSGALAQLDHLMGSPLQQSRSATSLPTKEPIVSASPLDEQQTLSLETVRPLSVDSSKGRALIHYLTHQRGIDPMLAAKYLLEVQYRNQLTGKTYFAVGINNETKGYEIRNAYFKSSLGRKGVSFIEGKKKGHIAVFEGFMDFLAALTYYQSSDLAMFQELVQGDVLIMNSAAFYQRTSELLRAGSYTKVALYLDNDTTGHKVRDLIQEQFPPYTTDYSKLYKDYKDFNEFLLAQLTDRSSTRSKG
ncbi:toprim domain-containing protein [Spirosoma linguale]|uniref:Zinc finger CHC2-family protein n=1 Tax=Spirosoma linguale (strain ATCC 33905 / DSM 74 / LMG 10896 / Claus 1) TaxID=504472 RepID=D2QVW7_SPILD|nr:hypothetical protein Slin_7006 [Spirosoma linguale DSM 74]